MTERWLITGAKRGIGLALVKSHLARGGRVVAAIRNASAMDELDALRDAHSDRCELVFLDLAETASVVKATETLDGSIDVLISNAGVFGARNSSFMGLDYADALHAFDVNALGFVRLVEVFLALLRSSKRPRIGAITSLMGASSKLGVGMLSYRASKAALNKLVQAVGEELYADGVAVAALRPGSVQTRMNDFKGQITTSESAAGIIGVMDALQPSRPVKLIDYTGEELQW